MTTRRRTRPQNQYANCCQISQTETEIVLDFGFRLGDAADAPARPVARIILPHQTAAKLGILLAPEAPDDAEKTEKSETTSPQQETHD